MQLHVRLDRWSLGLYGLALLREGHQVTILEPGPPGGEQAASYGNGCWLSPMSVIPPATPGLWRKVPGFLADPLGPRSAELYAFEGSADSAA